MIEILDYFVASLRTLDPALICLTVFLLALMENLFPPLPSDLVIVFGGSLVSLGRVTFPAALLAATVGGTIGFILMYGIGRWFGRTILEAERIRFIRRESVERVDAWFRRYGFWLVVANRFLAGTRAVVSFVAGMSGIGLVPTIALCALSALAWNAILLAGGYYLGDNWQQISSTLVAYSGAVVVIIALTALVGGGVYLWRRFGGRTRT